MQAIPAYRGIKARRDANTRLHTGLNTRRHAGSDACRDDASFDACCFDAGCGDPSGCGYADSDAGPGCTGGIGSRPDRNTGGGRRISSLRTQGSRCDSRWRKDLQGPARRSF